MVFYRKSNPTSWCWHFLANHFLPVHPAMPHQNQKWHTWRAKGASNRRIWQSAVPSHNKMHAAEAVLQHNSHLLALSPHKLGREHHLRLPNWLPVHGCTKSCTGSQVHGDAQWLTAPEYFTWLQYWIVIIQYIPSEQGPRIPINCNGIWFRQATKSPSSTILLRKSWIFWCHSTNRHIPRMILIMRPFHQNSAHNTTGHNPISRSTQQLHRHHH